MNNQTIEGNWHVLKGKIRQQWAKLTDNDMEAFKGNAEEAKGRLQKAYGYTKEQAQDEFEKFKNSNATLFGNEKINPDKPEKTLY